MDKAAEILKIMAAKCNAYVLHGRDVTVSMTDIDEVRRTVGGQRLYRGDFSLAVFGDMQDKVLTDIAALENTLRSCGDIYSVKLTGIKGNYDDNGDLCYTLDLSCLFFGKGGAA